MIEFEQDEFEQLATIKVIGVGGGGSNAVKRMIQESLTGVDFYVVNTDLQALRTCKNATQVPIGKTTTNGLGAGADAEKGRKAAFLVDRIVLEGQNSEESLSQAAEAEQAILDRYYE